MTVPRRGCLASSRAATSAVIADGDTGSPRSSTTKQRSASPSKARPRSAPVSRTRACRSTRFFGSSGLASWFGKVPSSSKYIGDQVERQAGEDGGHGVAAHAVARVDDDLQRPDRRQVDQRAQVGGVVARAGPRRVTVPGVRRPVAGSAGLGHCSARSRISARPVSWPTGRGAGPAHLDAVVLGRVVAGGEHRAGQVRGCPLAKYSWSVEHRPISVTSAPRAAAPRAKARRPGRARTAACRGRRRSRVGRR